MSEQVDVVSQETEKRSTFDFYAENMPKQMFSILFVVVACIFHWLASGTEPGEWILRATMKAITIMFLAAAALLMVFVFSRGKRAWAPVLWLRAKLPKGFYPADEKEAKAFQTWAFKECRQRVTNCIDCWDLEKKTIGLLVSNNYDQENLLSKSLPVSAEEVAEFRVRRRALEDLHKLAQSRLDEAQKESRIALLLFHRAWNVLCLLRVLNKQAKDATDFINAIKTEEVSAVQNKTVETAQPSA